MKKLVTIVMLAALPLLPAACQTAKTQNNAAPDKNAPIDAEVSKAHFTENGNLVTDLAYPADKVLAAAKVALDKAGFKVTDVKTEGGATHIATQPKDATPDLQQSYSVMIEPKGDATHLTIRFGMYGHVPASENLLGMILRAMQE